MAYATFFVLLILGLCYNESSNTNEITPMLTVFGLFIAVVLYVVIGFIAAAAYAYDGDDDDEKPPFYYYVLRGLCRKIGINYYISCIIVCIPLWPVLLVITLIYYISFYSIKRVF